MKMQAILLSTEEESALFVNSNLIWSGQVDTYGEVLNAALNTAEAMGHPVEFYQQRLSIYDMRKLEVTGVPAGQFWWIVGDCIQQGRIYTNKEGIHVR
jgi:hypothetical protein